MNRFSPAIVFLCVLLIGTAQTGFSQKRSASKYKTVPVENGGEIRGVVKYVGPAVQTKMIETTKDQNVCGMQVPSEDIVVNEGRLRWVVVSIENISAGKAPPSENPLIDNKNCRFVPHVQGAMLKSKVDVLSEDPVLHNTHAYFGKRTLWNLAIPVQNKKIPKRLPRKPGIVEVKCDAHEWMKAWIVVFPHPYYATTDEKGFYQISEIPPGTYTVKAWHETLGTEEKEVKVEAGKSVTLDFEFSRK